MNYARASKVISALYAHPKFPLTRLRKVVQFAQYGISELASTEATGLPIIRMNNLQADGWDFSDLKYIELSPRDAARYLLEPGDILFNRTNSKELVGKCEVFREAGAWVFASYLIRVRLDTNAALPDFVSLFLNTTAGRAQIDRISRQIIGMSNVNAEELQDMVIPLAPLDIQRAFVAQMQAAREVRDERLQRANALLASLDAYLLDTLNITLPAETSRTIFAISLRQIEGALNPERYAGLLFAKCIADPRMDSVARILDAKVSPAKIAPAEEWDRIRIDDLPNQPLGVETLRSVLGSELEEAYFEVQENDILLARLGPTIQNAKFVLCPPAAPSHRRVRRVPGAALPRRLESGDGAGGAANKALSRHHVFEMSRRDTQPLPSQRRRPRRASFSKHQRGGAAANRRRSARAQRGSAASAHRGGSRLGGGKGAI